MHVDVEEWSWKKVMFCSRQLEFDLMTRRMEMEKAAKRKQRR
jgi:hypothetical protein